MKTLAVILHYNSCQYTDVLYELLKPEEGEHYDLAVIDNGSDEGKRSKYTTMALERNVYFGGGLNATFEWFLSEPQYDSLLFLNSDLIVGKNFVKNLRKDLDAFDILSPCIIQPTLIQNHWRQMWSWGEIHTRSVKWIDLQAPMFSRRFIEKFPRFDDLLMYGWGLDVLMGIYCDKENWKIGVCDFVPAIHIGSATINDNKNKADISDYCKNAEVGQWTYFKQCGMIPKVLEMRKWAEEYKG
jgi:hypothetical protein